MTPNSPEARPRLLLTLGDPAGIGPEVVLRAAHEPRVRAAARVVAVGSVGGLARVAADLGLGSVARVATPAAADGLPEGTLGVVDPDSAPGAPAARAVPFGRASREGGRQALAAIDCAADLCLAGAADGLVTAPISKEAIALAGAEHPGHTERLAARTGAAVPVMVLAADLPAGALRVALVTVHEPLARVAGLVTAARVEAVVRALEGALRSDLGIAAPRLAVLGLNPHAGDGGLLGAEEADVLAPALAALRADGLDVAGPFAADAYFGRAAWRDADAVVAMYHDQGLAPFKALAMGAGVNVTLGLPLVRTSPDHGTAYDIAGTGAAEADSFVAAVEMAAEIARRRAAGAR